MAILPGWTLTGPDTNRLYSTLEGNDQLKTSNDRLKKQFTVKFFGFPKMVIFNGLSLKQIKKIISRAETIIPITRISIVKSAKRVLSIFYACISVSEAVDAAYCCYTSTRECV